MCVPIFSQLSDELPWDLVLFQILTQDTSALLILKKKNPLKKELDFQLFFSINELKRPGEAE